jgi:hypothetical protein
MNLKFPKSHLTLTFLMNRLNLKFLMNLMFPKSHLTLTFLMNRLNLKFHLFLNPLPLKLFP